MRKPRIFVSSTCYDLSQVRADLKSFIEQELGYEAVLSEYPSFPVHPDKPTVESCKAAVRANCDILVLVVGDRYGSVDTATNRSITNGEYLEARALDLPIYTFVLKKVEALLPTWRNDRTRIIPDVEPGVLEFVDELHQSSAWVFPFELASQISDTLRMQWAYLFQDGLEKRKLLQGGDDLTRLGLRGEALISPFEEGQVGSTGFSAN